MHIRVNIHEAGALRNQRYAFTDRFTLVSELLQNARRAGARRIEVRYDEPTQSLQVSDDGGGIQDFQALLSLHASGWSPALREAEQAFGVGFSQCLYSARRCRVTSGAQQVDFDCAAALAQQPIEVTNTDASLPAPVCTCKVSPCRTGRRVSSGCASGFRYRSGSTARNCHGRWAWTPWTPRPAPSARCFCSAATTAGPTPT